MMGIWLIKLRFHYIDKEDIFIAYKSEIIVYLHLYNISYSNGRFLYMYVLYNNYCILLDN